MELISKDANFDFLGKAPIAFLLSALVIAGSLYVWFSQGDSKYGIDYKGGHSLIVKIVENPGSEKIRTALKNGGVENAVVQSFEANKGEYAIRLSGSAADASAVRVQIQTAIDSAFSGDNEILQTDFVGPTIGKELRQKSLIAIIIGLIGILGYIAYRFDFSFALGAVAALFHDVIVCIGVYLFTGHTINVATLAAALTIVGYSVNDTIIVFDRMREEMLKVKKFDLTELMNKSINRTLSRTVITSLLTLFSAFALLVFGGGAIEDLALFLFVGVITGTYSTIFIASPVARAWERLQLSRMETATKKSPA